MWRAGNAQGALALLESLPGSAGMLKSHFSRCLLGDWRTKAAQKPHSQPREISCCANILLDPRETCSSSLSHSQIPGNPAVPSVANTHLKQEFNSVLGQPGAHLPLGKHKETCPGFGKSQTSPGNCQLWWHQCLGSGYFWILAPVWCFEPLQSRFFY